MNEEQRLEELLEEHMEEQYELGNYDDEEEFEEEMEDELEEETEEMEEMEDDDGPGDEEEDECSDEWADMVSKAKMMAVGILAVCVAAALIWCWWVMPRKTMPDAAKYFTESRSTYYEKYYSTHSSAEDRAANFLRFKFKKYLRDCNRAVNTGFRYLDFIMTADDEDHDYIDMEYRFSGSKYYVSLETKIRKRLSHEGKYEIESRLSVFDKANRLNFETEPEYVDGLTDAVYDVSGSEGTFFCGRETFKALINMMQSGSLDSEALDPMKGAGRQHVAHVSYNWDANGAAHEESWYETLPFPVYDGRTMLNEEYLGIQIKDKYDTDYNYDDGMIFYDDDWHSWSRAADELDEVWLDDFGFLVIGTEFKWYKGDRYDEEYDEGWSYDWDDGDEDW